MNRATAGALALWLWLVAAAALGSCAGARTDGAAAYASLDARKDDIRQLWMQIRDWRVDLGMAAEPVPGDRALLAQAVRVLRRCAAAPGPDDDADGTCGDVCNLADAICSNADSICRIAEDLEDDGWAAGKCKSAKSSCKEATDRCCGCASDPAAGAGATSPR